MNDICRNIEFVRRVTLNTILDTVIKESEIHGFGLFSKNKIYVGTILCNLDGQVLLKSEYDNIESEISKNIRDYSNYFFMECNYLDDRKVLSRNMRTSYSYINHSRDPNVEIKYFPIRVVAIKEINKGEELTIDYRKEPLTKDYLIRKEKSFL